MGFFNLALLGPYGEIPPQYVDQALAAVAQQAGLPAGFNWRPYLDRAAAQHRATYGVDYSKRYTNWAYPVAFAVAFASADYPSLAPFVALTGGGSVFWDQANQLRDQALHAATSDTEYYAPVLLAAAFITAGLMAPAAVAAAGAEAGAVAAGAEIATVQGVELAALVESGTVGVEGAFLEAAAISGSAVTYSTATGAILDAVTPLGETVAFDATVDPFTQFDIPLGSTEIPDATDVADVTDVMDVTDISPSDIPSIPESAPSAEPSASTPGATQAVTDYAKKLALSELNKLVGGAAQTPGARAALVQGGQGVAPGSKTADITPFIALALVAGAYIYSKRK